MLERLLGRLPKKGQLRRHSLTQFPPKSLAIPVIRVARIAIPLVQQPLTWDTTGMDANPRLRQNGSQRTSQIDDIPGTQKIVALRPREGEVDPRRPAPLRPMSDVVKTAHLVEVLVETVGLPLRRRDDWDEAVKSQFVEASGKVCRIGAVVEVHA